MKINGTYLGKLTACVNSNGLVDRQLEIYQTKKGIKGYLFASTIRGWHRKEQVLQQITIETGDIVSVFPQFIKMFNVEDYAWTGTIKFENISLVFKPTYPITYQAYLGEYSENSSGFKEYKGDMTDNGECFKDYHAWKTGKGIIYMSEGELEDFEPADDSVNAEKYWTRDSWIQYVRKHIRGSYDTTEDFNVEEVVRDTEFIEGIAEDILNICDWQDLSTGLYECDYNGNFIEDNWIDYKNRKQNY
jgi:hypothetical protein